MVYAPALHEELKNIDSIIATRQRRANAGNKLQALLNSEAPLLDEDEQANNIFQEFEDDEDYSVDTKKHSESDTESVLSSGRRKPRTIVSGGAKSSDTDSDIDQKDDDMFSDSADSASENENEDEDAGERELQREERRRKKRDGVDAILAKAQQKQQQKQQKRTVDQVELERAKAVKRQRMRLSADNLMSENRRSSTRKAAVKNKEAVIQRLQESEARRAKHSSVTPTTKVVHKLTQEERLAEAIITEKKNTESLKSFYEQEEDRKLKRRAAMLARRVPMTSFVRYVSKTVLEPASIPKLIEEIKEEIIVPKKRDWKKKKIKNTTDDIKEEKKSETATSEPSDKGVKDPVDMLDFPGTDIDSAVATTSAIGDAAASATTNNNENNDTNTINDNQKKPNDLNNVITNDAIIDPTFDTFEASRRSTSVEQMEADYINFTVGDEDQESPKKDLAAEIGESAVVADVMICSDKPGPATVEDKMFADTIDIPLTSETALKDIEKDKSFDSGVISSQNPVMTLTDKIDDPLLTEEEHIDPSKLVVEGPPLCHALTTISLMEFPPDFTYSIPEIKTVLFGDQSLQMPIVPERNNVPTTHRKSNSSGRKKANNTHNGAAAAAGTVGAAAVDGGMAAGAKLGQLSNNPTAVAILGTGRGGLFGTGKGKVSPSLLNSITSSGLGSSIVPATAATPTGVSAAATLANAGIPKCVVTGKPCKFVDPKTGIPYSSMEAFQIIRTVTNHTVPWNNDFGVYIGAIGTRHAKGVPKGFADPEESVASN
jgi:vacuolar protein sorting-associated protein 72